MSTLENLQPSFCEQGFVFGVFAGIVLTIFVRFYLTATIPNQKRHHLKFLDSQEAHYAFSFLCLALSILLLPFIVTVITVFGLYRYLVSLRLRKKYGDRFGGLVPGRDGFWAVEDQSKSIINGFLIIEDKQNSSKTIIEAVRDKLKDLVTTGYLRDSKMFSTFQEEMGYLFLLKNNIRHDEILREFDTDDPKREFMSEEELSSKISEIGNLPMPKNNTGHMEILVGKKPIVYKGKKCYPLIFRIHHVFADGVSIIRLVTRCLRDDPDRNLSTTKCIDDELLERDRKMREVNLGNVLVAVRKVLEVVSAYTKIVLSNLVTLVFGPTSYALQMWMRPSDINPLRGKLSGEKVFLWKIEDNEELVDIARRIKRRVKGAMFIDILFTAVAASFHEYFQKKSTKLPKFMTALVPGRLDKNELKDSITDKLSFSNDFTFSICSLPIDLSKLGDASTDKISLIPRLKETMKQTSMMRQSLDGQINYWAMTILNAVMPVPFLKTLFTFPQCSMILSNLPGPQTMTVFGGYRLRDIVFWVPNRGNVGVGVTCLSYDNRFQMALIVDKALVSEEDDLNQILENIPKYLRLLDKETISGVSV